MLSNFVIGDDSDSDFDLPVPKRSSMFQRGVTTLRGSVRRVTRVVIGKITTKTVFGGIFGDSSDSKDSSEDSTSAVRVNKLYNYNTTI